MRLLKIIIVCLLSTSSYAQGFDCDDSFYIVVYTESAGESVLYRIQKRSSTFSYEAIPLSEKRRLTALSYNITDQLLYAFDTDARELININNTGLVTLVSDSPEFQNEYEFDSGDFSPDGNSLYMFGYNPMFGKDTQYFSIDVRSGNVRVGFLGVTSNEPVKMSDIATDPIRSTQYGYDKLENRLTENTGPSVSTLLYPTTGLSSIDALFFDKAGELYAYSPSSGLYEVNKRTGIFTFIEKGPEGTSADGCSCPYSMDFYKEIEPREIIPCEPFTVKYTFNNRLGQGVIINSFIDSFPPGFEITNISSDLIGSFTTRDETDKHVLNLERFIYTLGENTITLTVNPADDYFGTFGSQAKQTDFPNVYIDQTVSDDPLTTDIYDATVASIISENDIDLANHITYSCDGKTATITAPFEAQSYQWSTGSTDSFIVTTKPDTYSLMAINQCLSFFDSITINTFLDPIELDLGKDELIVLGDSIFLMPTLNRSMIDDIQWFKDGVEINCTNCDYYWAKPASTSTYSVIAKDETNCSFTDDILIEVDQRKDIYVPNAFSPNGDGINETLFISTSVPGQVISFEVYDRWGNLVFNKKEYSISDTENAWDGTVNGQSLGIANYIWRAELLFVDGDKQLFSGQVMIMSTKADE